MICGHRQLLDRRRVGVERLDLDLEAGVGGREHAVAAAPRSARSSAPSCAGVTQKPWIRTMVSAAVGSGLTAWSILSGVEIRLPRRGTLHGRSRPPAPHGSRRRVADGFDVLAAQSGSQPSRPGALAFASTREPALLGLGLPRGNAGLVPGAKAPRPHQPLGASLCRHRRRPRLEGRSRTYATATPTRPATGAAWTCSSRVSAAPRAGSPTARVEPLVVTARNEAGFVRNTRSGRAAIYTPLSLPCGATGASPLIARYRFARNPAVAR